LKHTIHQHPVTHKFALVRLPPRFVEGDSLPIPPLTRWFGTRDEVIATLPQLFDESEEELNAGT
jgi:hypothetical protein